LTARVDPYHVSARHQSIDHLVVLARWDDRSLVRVSYRVVLDQMDRHGGVMAWSIDDTGIPKTGTHSVGVAPEYCGNLGKEDSCQAAVSLSVVNEALGVPAVYRLCLPEAWSKDKVRRHEVGVPYEVPFQTKWKIALEEVDLSTPRAPPRLPWSPTPGKAPPSSSRMR
jgi:SRSO17 transposase